MNFTTVLAAIGCLYIGSKILSFLRLLLSVYVLPGRRIADNAPKGSWALVTGASDGIGKEYALQLAKLGYNILLVSRTQSKLDAIVSDLKKGSSIDAKAFAMDFAANQDEDYQKLKAIVDSLNIGILVNNVGQSHRIPVPFAETESREMRDIITINCQATLRVTQLVLPGMMKRRQGLILTMASFGGVLPTPLLATYSGSKAFLQYWSSALASELAEYNIRVELVQSYLITSAMSKIRRASWMVPTPRTFVQFVLKKIGRSGGAQGIAATSTSYPAHALMHWAISNLTPGPMNDVVIDFNRRMHEDIRARALRKEGKQKL
ncbi:estradiol 17-beta-dehydrogenase-like protein 12-b [Piedraia hortae CBS 480.64]|uniref:Very-long-chain 3-oxoacyl-CoA reductase n=1 Tax=Piedraia hortae CBS 480.64 TaxID=1314780 RepID=A0A6A7BYM5_9PEZI|nr:estradiol 17-beta-dehydrogenase-like protein 12-b [Piedraia hortae CBS 480.64]